MLPIGIGGNTLPGYYLQSSLRFRSSANAYLSRTPASSGSRTTWTWSGWVKRGALGIGQAIISCGAYSANLFQVYFDSSNQLYINNFPNSTTPNVALYPSQLFRDPSAWYHIVVKMDTTQATSSDRVKIYVNGEQVTSFSTATYPAQNATPNWNTGSLQHNIGARDASTLPLDGYITEVNFVDGQALTADDFGETDDTTSVWKPKRYTGTYGTNGFYLNFSDSTSTTTLGYDQSPNSNNWTTNNISLTAGATYDLMNDVPTLTDGDTANFATMNPLLPSSGATTINYSNGNLTATSSAGTPATESNALSTMYFPATGKFYAELNIVTTLGSGSNSWPRFGVAGYAMGIGGYVNFGGSSYGTFANGDVMNLAWDSSTGKIWFGKNGTWLNSGDPVAGTGNISTFTYDQNSAYVQVNLYSITATSSASINFGQRPFAYTPPTGFKKLNTYNLPDSTIKDGSQYFDVVTRAGNSSSFSVTGLQFSPDFFWTKCRNTALAHYLADTVRGDDNVLFSNLANAEVSEPQYITAISSDGYTLGAGANVANYNGTGSTYVDWIWRGSDSSPVSNTNGTITSTVSANTDSGFSVVTYTGNNTTGATVGHGLGVVPKMIIYKRRDAAGFNWYVYHASIGNANALYLNGTGSQFSTILFNNTTPSSTVFTLYGGGSDINNGNMLAYCFAEVEGFSKFGSYTGNGSADGPFVYTGFRPAFLLVKKSSGTGGWAILDTARDTYNAMYQRLEADTSGAEVTSATYLDTLSNGFKVRTTNGTYNASATTYIYMAFAENPFKQSLAR